METRLTKTDSTGTTSYTWDFENRLTSVTLPGTGGTVNFKYDPFGRRIEKIAPAGTTIYAYDGDNVVAELGGGGNLLAYYTQGEGIDEPLAMTGAGGTYFYHADGLGSITSLTDCLGQPGRQLRVRFLRQPHSFDRHHHEPLPVHGPRIRFRNRPLLLPRTVL